MALILQYVDKNSEEVEWWFVSACSLKKEIYFFTFLSLTKSIQPGQGYDRASIMKRDINGLKTLIKKDSPWHITFIVLLINCN